MCPVGLLPAAVCGIDIKEMLAGAKMKERCTDTDLWKNPALMQATAMYLAMTEKARQHHRHDALCGQHEIRMADFSIAPAVGRESLGKAHTRDGKLINAGSTPVKSLGVTDQHSQLSCTRRPAGQGSHLLAVDDYRAEVKDTQGLRWRERR